MRGMLAFAVIRVPIALYLQFQSFRVEKSWHIKSKEEYTKYIHYYSHVHFYSNFFTSI